MIKGAFYKGNLKIKDNQKIELPDFTIITGKNGSGKSQLLDFLRNSIDYNFELQDENGKVLEYKYTPEENLTNSILENAFPPLLNFGRLSAIAAIIKNEESFSNIVPDIHQVNKRFKDTYFTSPATTGSFNDFDYNEYKQVETVLKRKGSNNIEPHDFVIFGDVYAGVLFSTSLAQLFIRFYLTQKHYPELIAGQPEPWVVFEEMIKNVGINYTVTQPKDSEDLKTYRPQLKNIKGEVFEFSKLSSGEQTIISLIFVLYNNQENIKYSNTLPDVLLLDEPDANLHPQLTKDFLRLIEEIIVEKYKVKVIITTHSPSTVALASELSLFEMVDGVLLKSNRKTAIQSLTTGLSNLTVLYEHQKQIFVEAKADAKFYQELFDILQDYLDKEKILYFIPSGVQSEAGCTRVMEFTDNLYKSGNKSVYGMLDYDGKNSESERIIIFGLNERYAIENYFLDPIILAYFLIYEGIESPTNVGLEANINIRNFEFISLSELQNCIDVVVHSVKANRVRGMLDSDELINIKLLNGFVIKIPHWYLNSNGHKLEESCKETFQKLKGYKENKPLIEAITTKSIRNNSHFLSESVLVAFKRLQDLPID